MIPSRAYPMLLGSLTFHRGMEGCRVLFFLLHFSSTFLFSFLFFFFFHFSRSLSDLSQRDGRLVLFFAFFSFRVRCV